jgi:hypothetical protein
MDKKFSGGYVGLAALMIVVMLIVYFAAQQYLKFAESKHKVIPAEEQVDRGSPYTASDESPIDRAWGAKSTIETKYWGE